MARTKRITTTADKFVRNFPHYSDVALDTPAVVTRSGRPRHVLISAKEYDRLKRRDQQAFLASETPDRFLAAIEELAHGRRS